MGILRYIASIWCSILFSPKLVHRKSVRRTGFQLVVYNAKMVLEFILLDLLIPFWIDCVIFANCLENSILAIANMANDFSPFSSPWRDLRKIFHYLDRTVARTFHRGFPNSTLWIFWSLCSATKLVKLSLTLLGQSPRTFSKFSKFHRTNLTKKM